MEKVNIIIPMAGKGQRFIEAGYNVPKPLLNLGDKPIIEYIIKTMRMPHSQFVFIVRQDHCDEANLGAICTVLLAKEHFDDDNPVIIKDCDQIINWNPRAFMEFVLRRNADGAIVNIHTDRPNYSFSRIDSKGRIIETAEKNVIRNILFQERKRLNKVCSKDDR